MSIAEIIIGFMVGVAATIVSSYLIDLSAWRPFKNFRKIGVLKVFKNQEDATKSILKDIPKSSILYLLAMKGESFSNPEKPLSKYLHYSNIEHKYLISSLLNPYLKKRNSELQFDMSESITQSIKNIQSAQSKNKNIEIKQHKEVVRFRIILLNHCLYLSFQKVNIPGRESPVLKIDNNSSIYMSFSTLFSDLWDRY
jgi:hypothetical protein